jgi:hypothetical protein
MIFDGGILQVGADDIFGLSPKLVHRVQFGCAVGQPQQVNSQIASELSRPGCRVAPMLIQQKSNLPTTVMLMNQLQKSLEIFLPLMLASKQQTPAGTQVHRAKHDSTGIPAREQNAARFSPSAPVGPQRGKQQQIGFVLGQQDAAGRQVPDFAANMTFFCRARDRASTHSAAVSTHTPTLVARGVSSRRRTS